MKTIKLSQGYFALVDNADYTRCMQGPKWYANVVRYKDGSVRKVYAVRSLPSPDRGWQYMHRFILGAVDTRVEVDHKDHNGLNNQRYNLRLATHSQNMHNQRLSKANTSGYKGVCWSKRREKWLVRISVEGSTKHIGSFASKEDAKRAYDAAVIKLHGEFANTK